ncbi:MAG: TIGR03560 family F420-dependent LLM class oxidoreductase [Acidimicrobiales bacterium]
MRLPDPCLVVLVGPAGAGKTTWADANFPPAAVVSSDRLRAMVGDGEDDPRAGADAFELLELLVAKRLARRLTTVVDTLGSDPVRRAGWLELAARHGVDAFAVVFDTPAKLCRARNAARPRPVPAKALTAQLAAFAETKERLHREAWRAVAAPGPVERTIPSMLDAPALARRQEEDPTGMRFGLQIDSFTWPGGPAEIAGRLRAVAAGAEEAGFASLWVMDHHLQIPPAGPAWHDMLDSYTTLGFLAAATRHVRIGTLVTGVTYRNPAHLAKIVATLDVLSGGRAVAGLGAAWFEREHRAYGFEFPPLRRRYELLEDALELLPLMWGPGAPRFEGRTLTVAEAMCYPRPIQARIPILVGGSGERRTLRLAARHADACNLFGEAEVVAHKAAVLAEHCRDQGRDPAEVEITQLGRVLVGGDRAGLERLVERLRPPRVSAARFAEAQHAGTVAEHVGRFRGLAEAGVAQAIVSFPDLSSDEPLERFAEVIAAFAR